MIIMFNKMKVNSFYNKLKQGKRIDSSYFNGIDDILKKMIIEDSRFSEYIKVDLILNKVRKENEQHYVIDVSFIENLSEENLKKIIKKIISYYKVDNIDLTNLFEFLKRKLSLNDNELKEDIGNLLFSTVKNSYFSKIDYINSFLNLFTAEERVDLLNINSMVNFLTFHSKGTNLYYGYNNFFNNIINKNYSEDLKYNILLKIFDIMSKEESVKRLYLESIVENLSIKNIINILKDERFVELYKFKDDNYRFNCELLLDIVNNIKDIEIKKDIILKYFNGFDYINNVINSRNKDGSKDLTIDGDTIIAFYELGFIKENIDDLIIESCKDEVLFDTLKKYSNKEDKLLKISTEVDISLLVDFANKYNIDIFQSKFAEKFMFNDNYFKSLPNNKSDLIRFYSGNNNEIYFDKLSNSDNKYTILLKSNFHFNIFKLIFFAKRNNLDIFNENFAKKFSFDDIYFINLPINKSYLIQYYNGKNKNIYLEQLGKCKDMSDILIKSNFNLDIDDLIEISNKFNIDIYNEKIATKYNTCDKYFESLPINYTYLIKFYYGKNIELIFTKVKYADDKLNLLLNYKNSEEVLYEKCIDSNILNARESRILSELLKVKDSNLRNILKDYILNNNEFVEIEKIKTLSILLKKINSSNSLEILNFKSEISNMLLDTDNPLDNLKNIEEIFIKNNLPVVGKIYSIFEILHPNLKDFDFNNNKISPVLKNKSLKAKKIIIFNDLLKAALGSNNRSLIDFINNLEFGEKLYKFVINDRIDLNELDMDSYNILNDFVRHIITLYNNTKKGNDEPLYLSNDLYLDIKLVSMLFANEEKLADRIIKMFCHFAGFDTLDEIKTYIDLKQQKTKEKNYNNSKKTFKLEIGDLIKGIGKIEYLKNSLQNGCLSKEFLGASSSSDSTPLDTDVSKVSEVKENLEKTINNTPSEKFGPIWFIIKNNDRFVITRDSNLNSNLNNVDYSKLELFYTGVSGKDHYGIRTGFASSEIDYIITKDSDPRIGLEVALNGFYIPILDLKGNLIFTQTDYNNLRYKMSGLDYYQENKYNFSNNLTDNNIEKIVPLLENNFIETDKCRVAINNSIKKAVESCGLKLKTYSDGDLTEGFVELIDTGSTGRYTNSIDDGDFDFMLKVDNNILIDNDKLNKLKDAIKTQFISIDRPLEVNGNFRYKGVKINGLEKKVDIDINFSQRTNKILYSTDQCLKERLNTIKKQDLKKYKLVISNILLAKEILKSAEVYKPIKSPEVTLTSNGQKIGGLGGVGIENWILQNGGSLNDAIDSFLNIAEGKNFEEFKKIYYIWDFGENHMSADRNQFLHDNFVTNMSEIGYEKMKEVLKNYKLEQNKTINL